MRTIFSLFLIALSCFASPKVLKPAYSIDVVGNISDTVVRGERLYVATDNGTIDIFNWKTKKRLKEITFSPIHDFMGEPIAPKVFTVDPDSTEKKLLVQLQAEEGMREVYIYDLTKNTQEKILDKSSGIATAEVRYVDDKTALIATLDTTLMLFDIDKRKFIYRIKPDMSVFSDFQLDEKHRLVASSSESGIVNVNDVATGKLVQRFDNGNKDQVFKLDFKHSKIIAGGQDRKAVIYTLGSKNLPIIYTTSFPVYACALNKDATRSAFGIDENSDIGIFDNESRKIQFKLTGVQSALNHIVFIDPHTILASSDDNHILIWRLP